MVGEADRPQQSNHHCGEGRRQGSGSSVTRRRSPPSPRRSPPGRDRGNGRVARTPHATAKPLLTNVVLHDGVAARETVLVPEAVEDALRSVPLLAVAGPIVFQDPIDDSRERTQLWPPRRRASAIPWRHRERQHLTDRLAVYTKHPRGLAGAHPLDMTRPPNPCVQLHPIHPPRLPVRATLTEGYTRSHFGPPQPDRPAASVGDYCSAVLTWARLK